MIFTQIFNRLSWTWSIDPEVFIEYLKGKSSELALQK